MQTTQTTAYALMILIAGFAFISNYGRGVALAANGPETQMSQAPGYGPVAGGPVSGPMQYGLVQTGIFAVAPIDGTGRQSVMPVFQIVRLQSAAVPAAANIAPSSAPSVADSAAQQPAETIIPQGINVAPPAGMSMSGTPCEIKGVRVLTETPEACATAGGQAPALQSLGLSTDQR